MPLGALPASVGKKQPPPGFRAGGGEGFCISVLRLIPLRRESDKAHNTYAHYYYDRKEKSGKVCAAHHCRINFSLTSELKVIDSRFLCQAAMRR
jgi:hypothetical protein